MNLEAENSSAKLSLPLWRRQIAKAFSYLRRTGRTIIEGRGMSRRARSGPEHRAESDYHRHSAESAAAVYGGFRYLR